MGKKLTTAQLSKYLDLYFAIKEEMKKNEWAKLYAPFLQKNYPDVYESINSFVLSVERNAGQFIEKNINLKKLKETGSYSLKKDQIDKLSELLAPVLEEKAVKDISSSIRDVFGDKVTSYITFLSALEGQAEIEDLKSQLGATTSNVNVDKVELGELLEKMKYVSGKTMTILNRIGTVPKGSSVYGTLQHIKEQNDLANDMLSKIFGTGASVGRKVEKEADVIKKYLARSKASLSSEMSDGFEKTKRHIYDSRDAILAKEDEIIGILNGNNKKTVKKVAVGVVATVVALSLAASTFFAVYNGKNLKDAETQLAANASNYEKLQNDYDAVKGERDALVGERNALQGNYNSLKNKYDILSKEVGDLKTSIDNLNNQLSEFNLDDSASVELVNSLNNQVALLEAKIASLEELIEKLPNSDYLESIQTELNNAKSELQAAHIRISALEAENKELKESLDAANEENGELKGEKTALQAEISNLAQQVQDLTDQVNTLTTEKDNFASQYNEANRLYNECLAKYNEKVEQYNAKVEEYETLNAQYQAAVASGNANAETIAQLRTELDQKGTELNNIKSELNAANDTIDGLNKALDEADAKLAAEIEANKNNKEFISNVYSQLFGTSGAGKTNAQMIAEISEMFGLDITVDVTELENDEAGLV